MNKKIIVIKKTYIKSSKTSQVKQVKQVKHESTTKSRYTTYDK